MSKSKSLPVFLLLGIVVCCLGGCGDGGAADAIRKRRSNLQQLGTFYLSYRQEHQRAAASASELLDYMRQTATNNPPVLDAITSLEEGDIVLVWNGQLDDPAKHAESVLGFEAGVPSTGGYVVMADATVQLMTAKEFSESRLVTPAANAQ